MSARVVKGQGRAELSELINPSPPRRMACARVRAVGHIGFLTPKPLSRNRLAALRLPRRKRVFHKRFLYIY